MSDNHERIHIMQGDITKFVGDAIVNAANETLLGGGGVDGAIHHAAGPELLIACRTLKGCKIGEAKSTLGFKLPAKWIIHTVGPRGDSPKRDILLDNCYVNSLLLAKEMECKTIAFPAISTGIYRYPLLEATEIAFKAVNEAMNFSDIEVTFICFDQTTKRAYLEEYHRKFHIEYRETK